MYDYIFSIIVQHSALYAKSPFLFALQYRTALEWSHVAGRWTLECARSAAALFYQPRHTKIACIYEKGIKDNKKRKKHYITAIASIPYSLTLCRNWVNAYRCHCTRQWRTTLAPSPRRISVVVSAKCLADGSCLWTGRPVTVTSGRRSACHPNAAINPSGCYWRI